MGIALISIGVLLVLAGFVSNIYLASNTFKEVNFLSLYKNKFEKQYSKEDFRKKYELFTYLFLLSTAFIFGVGGCLVIFGGYSSANIELEGYKVAITVIFSILFLCGVLFFIDNFAVKYYKKYVSEGFKKVINPIFYSLIVLDIIFLFTLISYSYVNFPLISGFSIGENGWVWTTGRDRAEGFHVQFYAIFILSGAILVFLICNHRMKVKYGKKGMLDSTFLIAFPSGIIGARLWYCYVLEFDRFAGDFAAVLRIWDGGLAIMGGALLGIVAGVLWVIFAKKEIKILDAADMIVPTILIAQAIGRWGNFFNLEVYGYTMISVDQGWWLPQFIVNQMGYVDGATQGVTFALPLFFIEFLTNIGGYLIIRYLFEEQYLFKWISKFANFVSGNKLSDKTKNTISRLFPVGGCAGLYISWYGMTRVILEPLRYSADYYDNSVTSGWIMFALGLGIIALVAVYQYLLKDKFPKLSNRLYYNKETDYRPVLSSNENVSIKKSDQDNVFNNINITTELNKDENSNDLNEILDNKNKDSKKSDDINDF